MRTLNLNLANPPVASAPAYHRVRQQLRIQCVQVLYSVLVSGIAFVMKPNAGNCAHCASPLADIVNNDANSKTAEPFELKSPLDFFHSQAAILARDSPQLL